MSILKTTFAENIFKAKYSNGLSWPEKARQVVEEVTGDLLPIDELSELIKYVTEMKFIPGGRYLYYAGRDLSYYNNCFVLGGQEDTRQEWARLVHDAMSCLMVGGGIGVDYSVFREEGALLSRTGGLASGPIPLMNIMNEAGRNVMQGGSRRSAMYASLRWSHPDIFKFIKAKNWSKQIREIKANDFNFPAPLDMTNISVNYDDDFLDLVKMEGRAGAEARRVWMSNIKQMLKTAEPGMSFNFGDASKETLRNACAEFISEDDSDVCNLGSVNFGRIESLYELGRVAYLGSKFLVAGGYKADLPYEKVYDVRAKNRKIGLGLMGLHEWLLKKGYRYEMNNELHDWLDLWKRFGEIGADRLSAEMGINFPKRYRAIAPTGTIGILASTTTGIEPLYATTYKRRYLQGKDDWKYEYVVDSTAKVLIERYQLDPNLIETASSLASDPERRIKFQAEVQQYVDMGISSTLNLPHISEQKFTPEEFSAIVLKYAPKLRGLTVYPDGARGGQPLTEVPYDEAVKLSGKVYSEVECDT